MCFEIRCEEKVERFDSVHDAAEFLMERMPRTALDLRRWYVEEWGIDDLNDFVADCEWLTGDGCLRVDRVSLTEDALENMMECYWDGAWDQEHWHLDVLRWDGEGPELEHPEGYRE